MILYKHLGLKQVFHTLSLPQLFHVGVKPLNPCVPSDWAFEVIVGPQLFHVGIKPLRPCVPSNWAFEVIVGPQALFQVKFLPQKRTKRSFQVPRSHCIPIHAPLLLKSPRCPSPRPHSFIKVKCAPYKVAKWGRKFLFLQDGVVRLAPSHSSRKWKCPLGAGGKGRRPRPLL